MSSETQTNPTIAAIDKEIARLKTERERILGARWLAMVPGDAGTKLKEMAEQAASRIRSTYDNAGSDEWEIAPGVTITVYVDTNYEDEEVSQ